MALATRVHAIAIAAMDTRIVAMAVVMQVRTLKNMTPYEAPGLNIRCPARDVQEQYPLCSIPQARHREKFHVTSPTEIH